MGNLFVAAVGVGFGVGVGAAVAVAVAVGVAVAVAVAVSVGRCRLFGSLFNPLFTRKPDTGGYNTFQQRGPELAVFGVLSNHTFL